MATQPNHSPRGEKQFISHASEIFPQTINSKFIKTTMWTNKSLKHRFAWEISGYNGQQISISLFTISTYLLNNRDFYCSQFFKRLLGTNLAHKELDIAAACTITNTVLLSKLNNMLYENRAYFPNGHRTLRLSSLIHSLSTPWSNILNIAKLKVLLQCLLNLVSICVGI